MSHALAKSFESSSCQQVSALVIGTFLAFGAAANANAGGLSGGCYTDKGHVKAVLTQEGMQPIITGERAADNHNPNIFYLNDKGYGYNIELPSPNDKDQSICVAALYKNTHLNSLDNTGPLDWFPGMGGIQEKLSSSELAENVVMAAQAYTNTPDGREEDGKMILVSAKVKGVPSSDPYDKTSSVWSVDVNGVMGSLFGMRNFAVTPQMNAYIDQIKH